MSFKTVSMPPQFNKNRPNPPGPEREPPTQPQRPRSRRPGQLPAVARIVISLLVIWHLAAVFLAPLSISPSSPLVVDMAQRPPVQWYLDALYLNHGYHFFAPVPPTGHLIRYQVMDDRGSIIDEGEFPSHKDQWPRLRYHRYFMLADQCELQARNEAEASQWQREYLAAYGRQLLRQFDGASVRVQRVVHYPAFLDDVRNGMPLNDPRTYKVETEVVQRRQDLDLPAPNQSGAWNNWRQDVASGWQGGRR